MPSCMVPAKIVAPVDLGVQIGMEAQAEGSRAPPTLSSVLHLDMFLPRAVLSLMLDILLRSLVYLLDATEPTLVVTSLTP